MLTRGTLSNTSPLLRLPDELLLDIIEYCSPLDRFCLARASSRTWHLLDMPSIVSLNLNRTAAHELAMQLRKDSFAHHVQAEQQHQSTPESQPLAQLCCSACLSLHPHSAFTPSQIHVPPTSRTCVGATAEFRVCTHKAFTHAELTHDLNETVDSPRVRHNPLASDRLYYCNEPHLPHGNYGVCNARVYLYTDKRFTIRCLREIGRLRSATTSREGGGGGQGIEGGEAGSDASAPAPLSRRRRDGTLRPPGEAFKVWLDPPPLRYSPPFPRQPLPQSPATPTSLLSATSITQTTFICPHLLPNSPLLITHLAAWVSKIQSAGPEDFERGRQSMPFVCETCGAEVVFGKRHDQVLGVLLDVEVKRTVWLGSGGVLPRASERVWRGLCGT